MSSARPPSAIGLSAFLSSLSAGNRLNGQKKARPLAVSCGDHSYASFALAPQTFRSGWPQDWRAKNAPPDHLAYILSDGPVPHDRDSRYWRTPLVAPADI